MFFTHLAQRRVLLCFATIVFPLFGLVILLLSSQPVTAMTPFINAACFAQIDGQVSTYDSLDATAVQNAIDNASGNDVIKIAGTCAGVQARDGITQTLYISKSLTLQGGYRITSTGPLTAADWAVNDPSTYETILNAQQQGRVIYGNDVGGSGVLILQNLTIQNGQSAGPGGGIYSNYNDLQLINTTLRDNQSGNHGGGLYQTAGALVIKDSSILSNTTTSTPGHGAGFYVESSSNVSIENNAINFNMSDDDGAGLAVVDYSVASIISNTIMGNETPEWAAGVYIVTSTASFLSNTVMYNRAGAGSGGVNIDYSDGITVSGNTISHNEAYGNGIDGDSGGLYVYKTINAQVDNNIITNNRADNFGGGVIIDGATLTFFSNIVSSNVATNTGGGGIFIADGSDIHLYDNTISNNEVLNGNGGGLLIYNSAVTVTNSTIYSNSASNNGGGIYSRDFSGVRRIENTTISHNEANRGGGIYGTLYTNIDVIHTSIISNNAIFFGGGIALHGTSGNVNMQQSILANSRRNCLSTSGKLIDNGENISSDTHCSLTGSGSVNSTDPLILPLADNGGATWTHALQSLSPAVDAATSSTTATDQRGASRPQGAARDIGAYEYTVPVAAPAVTIAFSAPSSAMLSWASTDNCSHQLYESGQPYQGATGTPATISSPFVTPMSAAQNSFYTVQAVGCGGDTMMANEVGAFNFTLDPGN